ncbi:MAG: hypothetical protein A2Y62_20355 [Candidatus Fischerbacteria bacterium RBG_13_37_8]|uniref:Uncharacterized protein n=1 Tax=Candidatus Fischerbacteria bacterium RBG_13_37_8 TaxID=1817863 RepID=A0A1F5VVV9_9BACT|nr:MAG: hypothetical protein A2Y62_20355 [Candidatus Fischerbacteria bacterium RBG_13_37_8]
MVKKNMINQSSKEQKSNSFSAQEIKDNVKWFSKFTLKEKLAIYYRHKEWAMKYRGLALRCLKKEKSTK